MGMLRSRLSECQGCRSFKADLNLIPAVQMPGKPLANGNFI